MKGASIFKLNNGYVIHSTSETVDGFSIASKPFIRLDTKATIDDVVENILLALRASQKGVPTPGDWSKFNQEFIMSLGIKSKTVLNKENVKYCSIGLDNDTIVFTPTRHAVAPEKGFLHNPNEEVVSISLEASAESIANALIEALSRCE